jgi:hypothetical protein
MPLPARQSLEREIPRQVRKGLENRTVSFTRLAELGIEWAAKPGDGW